MPNYLISQGNNRIVLRNYEGVITTYTEPDDYTGNCNCCNADQQQHKAEGVASLLNGQMLAIEPAILDRRKRHAKK